jgi:hypothetical protein
MGAPLQATCESLLKVQADELEPDEWSRRVSVARIALSTSISEWRELLKLLSPVERAAAIAEARRALDEASAQQ